MEDIRLKLPEIKRPRNPFSNEGVRALAIVVAFIVLISVVVYFSLVLKGRESSSVLPATTQEETTAEVEPTEVPAAAPTEEAQPEAGRPLDESPTPEETPASPAGGPTATTSGVPAEAPGEILPEIPPANQ